MTQNRAELEPQRLRRRQYFIEGIAPSPAQVALAELSHDEDIRWFSDQAALVANNITVLRRATQELVTTRELTTTDIVSLHTALLPNEQQHRGLRTVQKWIGGSNWHPLDADFVPPPHNEVPTPRRPPGIPQWRCTWTIDPGRSRPRAVRDNSPFHGWKRSSGTRSHPYDHGGVVDPEQRLRPGLSAYRYVGDALSDEAVGGLATWLTVFIDAAAIAVDQANRLSADIVELQ